MANDQVLTVAQMQAAEQALIDSGTGVDELMQRAGRGAADYVWRNAAGHPVTVLCGPGNNGGDGYVIAEVLRERGMDVQVVAPLESGTDAACKARAAYRGPVTQDAGGRSGAVLIDCLFGSGLSRGLSEELERLLLGLAEAHDRAIAIDLPSGVSSDSGELLSRVPGYHCTIALGRWKRAHFLMPSMDRMGSLRLVDIGVASQPNAARLIAEPKFSAPATDAHKYRRGLLAVIGGAMPGAALLAARAAMHAGAGYVKLLADHSHPDAPADLVLDETPLSESLGDERIDAVLIGPGLGRDGDAKLRLKAALHYDGPLALDADALVLLDREAIADRTASLVLTPHEGEMAALEKRFGLNGAGSKVDRAQALAEAIGACVVAKGPDTVVADSGGAVLFAGPASSWLSVAGTGDVLAGILASRLAAGSEPLRAAEEALALHREAAHLAGPAFGAKALADEVRPAFAAFV